MLDGSDPRALRGADVVIKTLAGAGIERLFGLSGNQIMSIFDACIGTRTQILHTRHEAAAVFMAEAHAQLTGTVGVALVTAGGGFANTLGALYAAAQSETPLLLLSGDSPVAMDGQGAFQTLDQVTMSGPVTKFSARVLRGADVGPMIARALQMAAEGRPGPVHLALPQDVLEAVVSAEPRPPSAANLGARAVDLDQILAAAARPLILAAPRFAHWRNALAAQAAAELGAAFVAMESPRGLDDPAHTGLRDLAGLADLVLLLGKSADFTLGFGAALAPEAVVIGLYEADEAQLAVPLAGQKTITGDVGTRLAAWAAGGADRTRRAPDWPERAAPFLARRALEDTVELGQDGRMRLDSNTLCATVARKAARFEELIVVSDGGEFGQWAQAYLSKGQRVINGPAGGIGGALSQAIAASLAAPNAKIIAFSGDGSLGFHLAEFETAVRAGANLVLIIGNDQRWNAEHLLQIRKFGPERLYACDLSAARYDLAADALGATGLLVERIEDLEAQLELAFASKGPVCVNVLISGLAAPGGPKA